MKHCGKLSGIGAGMFYCVSCFLVRVRYSIVPLHVQGCTVVSYSTYSTVAYVLYVYTLMKSAIDTSRSNHEQALLYIRRTVQSTLVISYNLLVILYVLVTSAASCTVGCKWK
jgi:hypothetical protein